MDVDQHIVVHDHSFVVLDEPDPAHVRGEVVDLAGAADGALALLPATEVEQLELVGGRGLELGVLDIDPADPIALGLEALDQVVVMNPPAPVTTATSCDMCR